MIQAERSGVRFKLSNRMKLFWMAVPFLIVVFIFNYIPLFGWIYAFFDYRPGVPLWKTPFAGVDYFKLMYEERKDLFNVLRNTMIMSVLGLLCTPLFAAFAIFLNEMKSKSFKKVVQITTTLPNFISWVLVYAVFFMFFSSDGFINKVLFNFGWIDSPTNVLGNNDIVWYVQTGIVMWKGLGWGAIIYLAAIAGIDQEQYDAAKVDGAGRFRTIWHITVPGILPTFFVLLLLDISNMLSNGFDQYFVFYNPLVASHIEVLDYYTYRVGMLNSDFSYSTALGISKTVISIVLLFTVNNLAKRVRGESII
ncbi:ABC transporter permease [Paenibacillus radicis (ex Gao et al. 2016)]|uniref:Sugar ABC transporter permease n=1 Tax=Paenibacillus radicis (ex Gao et al. 2016) TaxID=1737354 RepID=A0A917HQ49_9BACL|nr:ABC transporter permease subunit [Paenibacillus radicis (ex Gao et al. 2016)]GGG85684.1 sugar ABC transporter permease [Paenibacillus radicis (ex Gao et al. 2016)]